MELIETAYHYKRKCIIAVLNIMRRHCWEEETACGILINYRELTQKWTKS